MKISRILQCIILCFTNVTTAAEYFYPVGVIRHEDKNKLCIIVQKDMKLQVWFWDVQTGEAVKGLSALYNAAGLQVLPSGTAFSFIHNDTIHIKEIGKRSAVMLDFWGLHDFSQLNWIDDDSCYFSARLDDRMQIFQANLNFNSQQKNHITQEDAQGESYDGLMVLAATQDADCLYPQKIDGDLFYIEKCKNGSQSIVKKPYIGPLKEKNDVRLVGTIVSEKNLRDVLYVHEEINETICFLKMIDSDHGFFLAHLKMVNFSTNFIDFKVFKIERTKVKNNWIIQPIFLFTLPLNFLLGKDRFYESVFPFLPQYYDNSLYFVTYAQNICHIGVFSCFHDGQVKKIPLGDVICTVPYKYTDLLYCGGVCAISSYVRSMDDGTYFNMSYINDLLD